MSFFTDTEHEKGRQATLYWQKNPPITADDFFNYAEYLYKLYEYREAVSVYHQAAEKDHIGAAFELGYCYFYGYGTDKNEAVAQSYFKKAFSLYEEKEPQHHYYIAMSYLYGFGTTQNEAAAWPFLETCSKKNAAALYEQGLYCLHGKGSSRPNTIQAVFFLRKAYDMGYEQAVFILEKVFAQLGIAYPDKIELTQAYSWYLGRILRAAEKNPCREYYERLSNFYETGYPDDTPDNKDKFMRMAAYYKSLSNNF